jgi:hypothetical protein
MKSIKGFGIIKDSFKTKQVRYGGYAVLITLAVVVGLILLNLVVSQFSPQIDLTDSKIFSLSDQSVQVLDQIKTPVNIYGLWPPGQENTALTSVIDLYRSKNANVRFEAMDPDKNPGFLVRYDKDQTGISRGSVIVEGEKGFRIIAPAEMYDYTSTQSGGYNLTGVAIERRLTSALLFVGTGVTPVIYEITGHNEWPLESLALKDTVERENYSLGSLNLITSNIPDDASSLIINAPKEDLSRGEADKILAYLDKGGRLLVLADYRVRQLSVMNEMLASYGIKFDYGVIQENDQSYLAGAAFAEIPDLQDHDITKPMMEKDAMLIVPYAMGVSETAVKRRSIRVTPLLLSSANSWLRTDLDETSPARVSSDIGGPVPMAAAVTDPEYIQGGEAQVRIVAIAAGSLLEPLSMYGQIPGNLDFFMNSLTWLEDRPEALSVRSKSLFLLPMRLNGLQMIIFGLIFVALIPLAFFVSGLVTWLRRRHL